ncbi:MAG TPA: dTDP-4-dehydrorhamnose reductase [Kaistella chaponensis]|jgi:dTDP-4-dehydrorhamnose reductase|uniref:dTDP-4-dehydrorhamnose reductase n=1 Tax=Kaistella chaponensis TaxID=713588 RepID=UPI002BA98DBC|nr:dTDP-4-dehydrorhamnose reductase [Kaistella chaponensis]HPW89311.1 dTDP-4-dehydrorhamnose reductase [Kaistella chaponensis]
MKKILIIGGNGQLGNCFRKLAPEYEDRFEFDFTDSQTLNIIDRDQVSDYFYDFKPDYCINASAYTAVDLAETESEKAFAVNAEGVGNLAEACAENKTIFIHISTDYVFDGETNISYSEDDFTNPQGVYGASKEKGEDLAMDLQPKTIILRTSWLYSEFNKNFVKTMLHLFEVKEELGIVDDQFGQPTNANDLAQAVMNIVEKETKTYGIFHFSNYPETTWFNFAQKIADFSGSKIKLNPIKTSEFPTAAKRPKRSTMSLDKIEEVYKIEPKYWQNSLEECIQILQKS